jgi:acetylornithine deacetylase/succinyl-diaminopimelate desuccinylase-like protein
MLLAAARPEVRRTLEEANTRASIIFTYDEEATTPELSMRGARLAVGALGGRAVAESRYFIAGEPTQEYMALTQSYGPILPMRAHKGRFLADFSVHVSNPGHVSELVQNAFMSGMGIVRDIGEFDFAGISKRDGLREAHIFSPAHSTAQVSAGRIKEGDFSISPSDAGFVMDMRTIPAEHEELVEKISALIKEGVSEEGVSVLLTTLKNAPGSSTSEDSPIVLASQEAVGGFPARGFNGGDEGRIFRLDGGKEGITLGPGSLKYAHQPNEQVPIRSVFDAADIYARLFASAVELPR